MKKLLLGTAAVALGLTFVAGPAHAQVKLDVGGFTKLYSSWLDQDTRPDNNTTAADESLDERNFDILRETELHFSGESTLDNGLTVGAHIEIDLDGSNDNFTDSDAEEAYAYFSGAWGRVNFGREDSATYLLQVAAPSADSNHDGIRQYVSPVNYALLQNDASTVPADGVSLHDLFSGGLTNSTIGGAGAVNVLVDVDGNNAITGGAAGDILFNSAAGNFGGIDTLNSRFDYDQAISGANDKLTYMTPVFNGFQAGFSYTPELNNASVDFGNNDDDTIGDYGDVWEVAARYEGQFNQLGVAFGGGYSHAELEEDNANPILFRSTNTNPANSNVFQAGDTAVATLDDREAWNVGIDFDWQAFGLGAAYMEDDNGISGDHFETETWVVGLDYTTGPFKIGGTYYDVDQNIAGAEIEVDRWTGGVVYTYGPGMTFRGSVSWIDHDESAGFTNTSFDATSVLLGTQINF